MTPRPSILGRVWFPVALAALLLLCMVVLVLVMLQLFGADGELNEWLGDNFQLSIELLLPWALMLMFLLIPLTIVLLYFLKLKRKPLQVPSTFLWRKTIEDLHVNSLFQWLRENVLLLLQLLVVVLLLIALLNPRSEGSTVGGQHYILMIDNSASMAATDVKPSRLEWARQEALKVIDAATEDSVGMVIVFNSRATTLRAYTSNKARLREAVNSIRQSHRPTRIEDALTLADSQANPRRSTEDVASRPEKTEPGQERTFVQPRGIPTDVYLFSDGRFPDPPESAVKNLNSRLAGNTSALGNMNIRFQLAGKKGAEHVNNIGIVGFSAARLIEEGAKRPGRDALTLQVLVQVRNYCPKAKVVKVRLKAVSEGKVLHKAEQLIDLPARTVVAADPAKGVAGKDEPGEGPVAFELPPLDQRVATVLHASLEDVRDHFPLDDQAWLVVGVVRKARVLLVGPGNPVLNAFFNQEATQKIVKVTTLAPADLETARYREAARSGEYDLVIFDRCIPASEADMPQANTLCIDRPPPPWRRGRRVLRSSVLVMSNRDHHPLWRDISPLWDVWVTDGFTFNPEDNLPEEARAQFNLDGKHPGRKALPPLTRLLEAGPLPALFTLPRGEHTDLVMPFPLVSDKGDLTTNWSLQPSFPLFLWNVLLTLGNVRSGMHEGMVQPGEPMVLRPEAGIKWLKVTPPGGSAEELARGRRMAFLYANTDRVGLYDVERSDGVHHPFAVNLLDPQESNIQPRPRFKVDQDTVSADRERAQPRHLWKWLVLGALGVLMLEWYIYNRRVHV
jgi:hypothetical protein